MRQTNPPKWPTKYQDGNIKARNKQKQNPNNTVQFSNVCLTCQMAPHSTKFTIPVQFVNLLVGTFSTSKLCLVYYEKSDQLYSEFATKQYNYEHLWEVPLEALMKCEAKSF